MLIEFSVANYLSFRERVTLSMVAANDDALPDNCIVDADGTGMNLLKSVAIWGPNASGKSNIVKALDFARRLVLNSSKESQSEEPIGRMPFKLSSACIGAPSEFEFVFLHEDVRYQYAFAVTDERVCAESLHRLQKGRSRPQRVFVRDSGQNYDIGRAWQGELNPLAGRTRENTLFVSAAAQWNSEICRLVLGWFGRNRTMSKHVPEDITAAMVQSTPEMHDRVMTYLTEGDVGIRGFTVSEIPFLDSEGFHGLPDILQESLRKSMPADRKQLRISTLHQTDEGEEVSFRLSEESDGTIRLFAFAGPWIDVMMNGRVLAIDEFDAELHALLSRWLLAKFHNANLNSKGQLIFTTHNTELLDLKLFRRDQIWLVEKDRSGATKLFSLWDFDETVRKDESVRKRYLEGRYGAIPILGGN